MITSSPPIESSAPPEVLASDLCWLLTRASQLQRSGFEEALTTTDLTPRKHQVLATASDGRHTQTELARIVGLDKTTMMVTLDELERTGLAERRPLPGDRRARIVAVTAPVPSATLTPRSRPPTSASSRSSPKMSAACSSAPSPDSPAPGTPAPAPTPESPPYARERPQGVARTRSIPSADRSSWTR
jgi:hypothetical protein